MHAGRYVTYDEDLLIWFEQLALKYQKLEL